MDNIFDTANQTVQGVEAVVSQRIQDSRQWSQEMNDTALAAIAALQSVNFNFPDDGLPYAPVLDYSGLKFDANLTPITPTSFGTVGWDKPDSPMLEDMPDPASSDLNFDQFVPTITNISIPEAPSWVDIAAPVDPGFDTTVSIPVSPDFQAEYAAIAAPSLIDITIPDFAGLTLPTWDGVTPDFEGTPLPDALNWSEPTYAPQILPEALAQIRAIWNGALDIPTAVEKAMFDRAADREDAVAEREIDAVNEEFSLRGFTMPTGMQAARMDQMRQDLAVKKNSLNRDLTIDLVKIHSANVQFAIQQALAAENVYVNLFTNATQRLFEAAKFQIQSQIEVYNAQVSVFNAKVQSLQVQATVFSARVNAALSAVEVYKAEVQAEVAKGQINEQKVQVYTAQIQAITSQVEGYRAEVQAATARVEAVRAAIEAYKADVEAYAQRIAAQKTRFDAYIAQVQGEQAKAQVIQAEAQAYAALIQGKATVADIDIKRADFAIEKNKILLMEYQSALETEKAKMQAQLETIQVAEAAYDADTKRFTAQIQAQTAEAQLQVSATETELRSNISFYQAKVQAYLGKMEQMIREVSVIVQSLQAAGSISSTLAAGAMAAVHVGAQISGSGGVSASGAYSEVNSTSKSTSDNTNTNYEGT